MKDPLKAVIIAAYWFAGAYTVGYFTPEPIIVGLIGLINGLVLLERIERARIRGELVPVALWYALWIPPIMLIVIGAVLGIISR